MYSNYGVGRLKVIFYSITEIEDFLSRQREIENDYSYLFKILFTIEFQFFWGPRQSKFIGCKYGDCD